jgi:hypothetical protein
MDNLAGGYYLTLGVVDWVDVFTRKKYKDIILDCFTYLKGIPLPLFLNQFKAPKKVAGTG